MNDDDRKRLAAYTGAVSRWCDLTGHVVDAPHGDKADREFAAFNRHLDELAEERRRLESVKF